ncbi:MAG: molybdopterin molybdotransferase MoeA [Polaribacter sp.]|nr:molybdopterin molybdotransferase MoeA [Polaribacter sp.]
MVSVKKAFETVLNSTKYFGVEKVPFIKSLGRILKEEISADRDFPPFNRVSMDGIAIDYASFRQGQKSFEIEGIQAAGSKQIKLNNSKNCIEVMTGAVLPKNANTVIRYEDVTIKNGITTINVESLNDGQNVHIKGKDGNMGDILISENIIISAAEIGVLATVGKSFVKVAKQPKVMIVSTGDELVGVDEVPLEHQIRRSNVFTLVSLLERLNIYTETAHITDDKPILKTKIKKYLQEYDVLLFSGAVSKGKYDFLPEVFDELGVKKLFHKVAQRPGKPFFYGQTDCCTVFGFPGNPISTFVNCLAYFYPWYYKSVALEVDVEMAVLAEDVSFKPNLVYFLQVKLKNKQGKLIAFPIKGNGSGDLASLVNTDAFIQLPDNNIEFKKGDTFPIIRYR